MFIITVEFFTAEVLLCFLSGSFLQIDIMNGLNNELICFVSGDNRITQSAHCLQLTAATRC